MAKSNFSVLSNLKAQMSAPPDADEVQAPAEQSPVASNSIPSPAVSFSSPAPPPPAPTPIAITRPAARRSNPESSRRRRTFQGPTIQMNADIPKDLHRQVKFLLLDEDRSLADLLETLLREYVSKNKK